MARIFVLYKLKPGVSREDFETWLKTNNSTALRSIKRLEKFTVFPRGKASNGAGASFGKLHRPF